MTIGNRVTAAFLNSSHGVYNSPGTKPHIPYFEVCAWYGALSFAQETQNDTLLAKLRQRFEPLWTTDSALLPVADHVDYSVFGAIPLKLYLQTNENKFADLGKKYADMQWGTPFGPRAVPMAFRYFEQGYSWQTRLWIDDMYMITLLQTQAYLVTRDTKYTERTAREMVLYLDSLQQPNGLFYHAPTSPFFWGRGNGWMAAGLTTLLRVLPENDPAYPRIMKGYRLMMRTLLHFQDPTGMWRQLIDDLESWKETSCTGMFAYAFITGIKRKWITGHTYRKAAKKAWVALSRYVNDNGEVSDCCEGTGAGNSKDYYLFRKRVTGDFHGQAPVLWCAEALLEK